MTSKKHFKHMLGVPYRLGKTNTSIYVYVHTFGNNSIFRNVYRGHKFQTIIPGPFLPFQNNFSTDCYLFIMMMMS